MSTRGRGGPGCAAGEEDEAILSARRRA